MRYRRFVSGTLFPTHSMKMSEFIRDDIFYFCTEKNVRGVECQVSLSSSFLTITEVGSTKKRTIKIDDVIGCLCMRSQDKNGSQRSQNDENCSVFLCVYFYPLSKTFNSSLYRKRETALLRCCKFSSFVENCDLVSKYKN